MGRMMVGSIQIDQHRFVYCLTDDGVVSSDLRVIVSFTPIPFLFIIY